MRARIIRADRLRGRTEVPGDKSISHRALMFAALSDGRVELEHLSTGADVRSTASCLRALGASIEMDGAHAWVEGVGLSGLRQPDAPLDCGNSGTTMRLLSGVVAGARLNATLDGDASLCGRPMQRVLTPLRAMGAEAKGTASEKGGEKAPLRFTHGAPLQGRQHELAVASAQVKSCILLAGLFAEGETSVFEPRPTRDHTERMLPLFGVELEAGAIAVRGPRASLRAPARFKAPGDFSSAAFLAAAAVLTPDADLLIEGVNTNPRRTGFLRALLRMGADVSVSTTDESSGEPVSTLHIRGGRTLRAIDVEADDIPDMVDEIPILAVVAAHAQGKSTIRGAGELRVKESDRLLTVASGLARMGARVEELSDGLIIEGGGALSGASIETAHDHRIAMAFTIAGLTAAGQTIIEGAEWADISFPGFFALLSELTDGKAEILA